MVGAAPASAAPWCAVGAACFCANPDGSGQVIVVRDEVWQDLTGFQSVRVIVNDQVPDDDACAATGVGGTGQQFCVPGGSSVLLPAGVAIRSVRG
ncbi:hypothetical protein [Umezawaea sp.]|uniref:hypothetical protein n=1 Tax=Umezawaea sp. TaxID=1955258 RepID=UPI002ED02A0E